MEFNFYFLYSLGDRDRGWGNAAFSVYEMHITLHARGPLTSLTRARLGRVPRSTILTDDLMLGWIPSRSGVRVKVSDSSRIQN